MPCVSHVMSPPIQAQDGASRGPWEHLWLPVSSLLTVTQQLFLGHGNNSMQTRVPTMDGSFRTNRNESPCAREGFSEKVAEGMTSYTPGDGCQTMPRANKVTLTATVGWMGTIVGGGAANSEVYEEATGMAGGPMSRTLAF